jgi:hypothetical protein
LHWIEDSEACLSSTILIHPIAKKTSKKALWLIEPAHKFGYEKAQISGGIDVAVKSGVKICKTGTLAVMPEGGGLP